MMWADTSALHSASNIKTPVAASLCLIGDMISLVLLVVFEEIKKPMYLLAVFIASS